MNTYSLTRQKYLVIVRNGRKVHKAITEIVATGLSWSDAKSRRKQDRTLSITHERTQPATDGAANPAETSVYSFAPDGSVAYDVDTPEGAAAAHRADMMSQPYVSACEY